MKSDKPIIVIGLLFGDEAKSATVDFLSSIYKPEYGFRFGGGSQCAHNVVVNDLHHCFSQFSAATFNGATTVLTKEVVFDPLSYEAEREKLGENGSCAMVDENCLVVTPYHIAKNRITEKRLKHGSCGRGVWATKEYAQRYPERALRVSDMWSGGFYDKTDQIREDILAEVGEFEPFDIYGEILKSGNIKSFADVCYSVEIIPVWTEDIEKIVKNNSCIFEGHQGVLLDENHGYMPYVSGSGDCTAKAAEDLLFSVGRDYEVVGTIRSYMTRHGAGPFKTERGIGIDEHNKDNPWQGPFRHGLLDIPELRRVLGIQRVDSLSINCLDNDPYDTYWDGEEIPFECTGIKRAEKIAKLLDKPIKCLGFGPKRSDRMIY